MANYSKESKRQNKALSDLLSGKTYEKDYVQVGYEGKQENLGGKTREGKMTKIMKDVRMPWFCPKCKKTMKKKLDRKFWSTQGHCFDCQIEYENKLKMKGEFNAYAQTKVLENQKAYLRDMEQSIDDFEKTDGKQSWFNSVGVNDVELEEEKWEMGKEEFEKVVNEAREFIKNARENVEKAEKQLQGDK